MDGLGSLEVGFAQRLPVLPGERKGGTEHMSVPESGTQWTLSSNFRSMANTPPTPQPLKLSPHFGESQARHVSVRFQIWDKGLRYLFNISQQIWLTGSLSIPPSPCVTRYGWQILPPRLNFSSPETEVPFP